MARPKKTPSEPKDPAQNEEQFEAGEEAQAAPTIKDLKGLRQQWKTGKLPLKIHVALRTKLLGLYKGGSIHPDEEAMLWDMLKRERAKGQLGDNDGYVLAHHESLQCEDKCRVKNGQAPHGLVLGAIIPYFFDGEADRFHVYPIRVVPPDHQLDMITAKRIAAGITVDPATFPPEKRLTRHLVLNPVEFGHWLEHVSEDELAQEDQEYAGLLTI